MTRDSRSWSLVVPVSLRDHALFLDFDGTLAPLQDNPDAVALPEFGAKTLIDLHSRFGGAVALISGRDIRDLSLRTPNVLRRGGGHGLDICEPGEAPPVRSERVSADLLERTEDITAKFEGVRIEEKGPVLAIHFRQNPGAESALLSRLTQLASSVDGYKAQHGKMVIELKPERANKGIAIRQMMQLSDFAGRTPIMVGDDTTDEDAMRVAAELGGFGVKGGTGPTVAEYRIANTELVWDWLRSILDEHA